jgi:hypothetical protein
MERGNTEVVTAGGSCLLCVTGRDCAEAPQSQAQPSKEVGPPGGCWMLPGVQWTVPRAAVLGSKCGHCPHFGPQGRVPSSHQHCDLSSAGPDKDPTGKGVRHLVSRMQSMSGWAKSTHRPVPDQLVQPCRSDCLWS